ncbi:MAG: hypothetical protein IJ366_04335 [Clostridia bacterium]|nr:hypothetical protein [Clostridia bacterium]
MKKTYAEPEIKVSGFDVDDVITTSITVNVDPWGNGGTIIGGEAEEVG